MATASTSRDVKGKGRATETTPLLAQPDEERLIIGGSSATHHVIESPPPSPRQRRARLQSTLVRVFLVSFLVCIVVLVGVALLIWSYARRVEGAGTDDAVRSISWVGPDNIQIIDAGQEKSGVLTVRLSGRVGVNADIFLGWDDEESDDVWIWESAWRSIGRWGVGVLREVNVSPGKITVFLEEHHHPQLFTIDSQSFTLPLTAAPPSSDSWLSPISVDVEIRPTNDSSLLQRFAEESWRNGFIKTKIQVESVHVTGGDSGWRRLVKTDRENVQTIIKYKIPDIPGVPKPHPPLEKLLNLVSYTIMRTPDQNLSIAALATLPNPLPSTNFKLPFLPYRVSLLHDDLEPLPIATGSVKPQFSQSTITLPIQGIILPISNSNNASSTILSAFLSGFLSGISPPIRIQTPALPSIQVDTVFPAPDPPPRVLRDVQIKHMYVTIAPDGHTILASGQVFARLVLPKGVQVPINATGVWPDLLVYDGEVPDDDLIHQLYNHLEDFTLPIPTPSLSLPLPKFPEPTVPKLPFPLPSIGLPHPHDGGREGGHGGKGGDKGDNHGHKPGDGKPHKPINDDPAPLPDPLPKNAFARIRPQEWLQAITIPDLTLGDGWVLVNLDGDDDEDDDGWAATVTADIHEVPLQVLPGRDAQLRSFVSKVLLSKSGALAGIKGTAAVRAHVPGLLQSPTPEDPPRPPQHPGDPTYDGPTLELDGLPFQGSVMIGKKGLGF